MARMGAEEFVSAASVALAAAAEETETEAAFGALTGFAQAALGDPVAALKPGALKPGERDYRVSGVFLITPDRRYNMLTAARGFPPEQRRLSIPIGWNHPGEVVRTGAPILLENTDDHGEFRQFLKTSRMGSSIYFPLRAGGAIVGQIVAASQARGTYERADVDRLGLLAASAGLVWTATRGGDWLEADYPASDIQRVDEMQ